MDKSCNNAQSFILWMDGWMDEMMIASFQCRSLAWVECIRDLDHGSMMSLLQGSQQFNKAQ
jgi:hypothetical protein